MDEEPASGFKAPTMPPQFLKPAGKDKPPPVVVKSEEKAEKTAQIAPEVADLTKNVAPPLEYTPPSWACEPDPGVCEAYKLEILKNGTVVTVQDFENRGHNPTFLVIGRLPNCDIIMEHPSVSRYHCILQYGDDKMDKKGKGWFIYDMGSTHGTKMNKNRLPPKQFIRLQVGFVFQFGNSTRICSLLGPSEDSEPEWDLSPTEMREKMQKRALEAKLAAAAKKEIEEEKQREEEEDQGIDWGMDYGEGSDAAMFDLDGEADGEAYYNDDPKKALAKFFERVGFEMNFTYTEGGAGHTHKWTCSIELPLEIDGVDRAFTASATVSTSKKDATVQCALEACRILDRHGALRGTSSRVRMKKKNLEDNDYYDEDDDLFFDRTGQLELQRDKRKQWTLKAMGKSTEQRDTYETLSIKLKATRDQMAEVQKELDELGHNKAVGLATDVDDYVNQLAKGRITVKDDMQTKIHKSTLRQKLVTLTHEAQTLEKLCKITKPTQLPDLQAPGTSAESASKQAFLRKLAKFGNVKKELATAEAKAAEEQAAHREMENGKAAEKVAETPEKIEAEIAEQPKPMNEVEEAEEMEEAKPTEPVKALDQPSTSLNVPENAKKGEVRQPTETAKHQETRKRPQEELNEDEEEEKEQEVVQKKTKKPRVRKEKWEEYGSGCEHKDEQYATWMPPENQSGDGSTSLNAKFAGRY